LTVIQKINDPDEHEEKMNHIFEKLNRKGRLQTKLNSFIPIGIAIYILIMKKLFNFINVKLTDNENHEKQVDWDNSYTLKKFAFSVVNCYYSIYYILFVKNFSGKCVRGENCFGEIKTQLTFIIIVEFISIIIEIGVP